MVLSAEDKESFLKHVTKSKEDWQVKQADDALRLYEYFLTGHGDNDSPTKKTESYDTDWTKLKIKTIEALRLKQRSYRTEQTYLNWLRVFQKFVDNKNPADIEAGDIQEFLSYLAVERRVAPSTQNQALNALIFIYRYGLDKTMGENELKAVRAAQKRRLPVVLTTGEIHRLFDNLSEVHRLMAMLIYGCGLRLQECIRLRIKMLNWSKI